MTDIDQYIVTEPDKTFTVRVPPFMDEGYKSINAARKQVRELLAVLKTAEESDTVPAITKKMVEAEISHCLNLEVEDRTIGIMVLAVAKYFKIISGFEYQKMLRTLRKVSRTEVRG